MKKLTFCRCRHNTLTIVFFILLTCFSPLFSFAADVPVLETTIPGLLYETDDKNEYDYSSVNIFKPVTSFNSYGHFFIKGTLAEVGVKDGFRMYNAPQEPPTLHYVYTDKLLTGDEESRQLCDDSAKTVAGTKLSSAAGKGVILLLISKDGQIWQETVKKTNALVNPADSGESFYNTTTVQLTDGCYFRFIVAYETRVKTGESKFLFVNQNQYSYRRNVEIYDFYLSNGKSSEKGENEKTKVLGSRVRAAKENNGYAGSQEIDLKDPHYGWDLGTFSMNGYTSEITDADGTPVFLKNVSDKPPMLRFTLLQNIDKLNGKDNLSIANDAKGYDRAFEIQQTDFGRGALIIRHKDETGKLVSETPYTNFLAANASLSADTDVRLFEEGDYEVALDYKIKITTLQIGGIEIIPSYADYRIYFSFKVRNGNCMIYPFDLTTGSELTNESITENGFSLDWAKSKYLSVDVRRSVPVAGINSYSEDVRFDRPAKDGDKYTDEGIYTFTVTNQYTVQTVTKTIYVGDSPVLKALSLNKLSVIELNVLLRQGYTIANDGTLIAPPAPEEPEDNSEPIPEITTPEDEEEAPSVKRSPAILLTCSLVGLLLGASASILVRTIRKEKL